MNLDLHTLLYLSIAAAAMAAAVLSFFGATQSTHAGYRSWVAAQWLLVLGLLLSALDSESIWIKPLAGVLVLQWPIGVLGGMRLLQARKRPLIPGAADWAVLALAGGLYVAASAGTVAPVSRVAAYALAAGALHLYAAVLVSRLGGFRQSAALRMTTAMLAGVAALEMVGLGLVLAAVVPWAETQAALQIAAMLCALGMVPLALALSYERTLAKMRATHHKLRHLADVDVLTRLPNRRHFHELAARALTTSDPATTAVLMFDIENLKRINDLLGPSTGDEALRQVGLVLRETLRSRDVAGRIGGDEFAALLPDTTVSDAVRVADRIIARLEDRQVAPRTARLTLNVGAVQMQAGDTVVEALRRADMALDDARGLHHGRSGTPTSRRADLAERNERHAPEPNAA